MAKLYNRARMTISSTGTGTLTLGSAVTGYQTFASAGVANGDVVSYAIEDGANWEIGTGTYTSSGTTLSRTVTASSNAGSAISVTTSAQVYVTALVADIVNANNGVATGLKATKVAISASDIDLNAGNYFTKTISGATTFTVSNVPSSGTVASFILELTNPGTSVTWWSGVKWVGGTQPTWTGTGVDVLAFYTVDGGTTWRGFAVGKDSK